MKKSMFKRLAVGAAVAVLAVSLTGCVKPYNTPEFVDILPNETAFLVPLEGQTSNQASFDSEQFLKDSQVATKRIEIPHRFVKTGRYYWQGEWKDTMSVIKVDRTQETREWTVDSKQGIKARSKDSIGFTVGVSATSGITDAPKFLFRTSGSKTLAQVMDSEIRNRIETKLIEQFAKYDMAYINANKGPIMEQVAKDAVSYFTANRGIEISNMGYKGDIVYDDPKVQESMNTKFTAIQDQETAATNNLTAIANAEAKIKVKKADAEAAIEEAKGIAEANRELAKSISDELIRYEVAKKWNGAESYVNGGGSNIIQVPSVTK